MAGRYDMERAARDRQELPGAGIWSASNQNEAKAVVVRIGQPGLDVL